MQDVVEVGLRPLVTVGLIILKCAGEQREVELNAKYPQSPTLQNMQRYSRMTQSSFSRSLVTKADDSTSWTISASLQMQSASASGIDGLSTNSAMLYMNLRWSSAFSHWRG